MSYAHATMGRRSRATGLSAPSTYTGPRHDHACWEDGSSHPLGTDHDGTYDVVDENTFLVSKEVPDVTFNFTVQGDSITFEPVIPLPPDCFKAAWSVAVAYPAEEWRRVSE
jgi:hypothetical protein